MSVIGSDVFPNERIFFEACFGLFEDNKEGKLEDGRIINLSNDNSWFSYLNNLISFYNNNFNFWKPKGAFLHSEFKRIHGVLFITTNRTTPEYRFIANPFVEINNNNDIMNFLSRWSKKNINL